MRCVFCENPATVHLTEQVNGTKREVHLCERCARERQLLPNPPGPQINLKALLNLLATPLLGQPAVVATPPETRCPKCGLTHAAFKAEGRLGCGADYEIFRATLEQLLERVHRAVGHVGKCPTRVRAAVRAARIEALREQMKAAVENENYEAAAAARDAIRELEAEGITG
jgi:protein arginine kinase activator